VAGNNSEKKPRALARGVFIFQIIFVLFCNPANAEDMTITTYYPSPNGSYDALSVKRLSVGDTNGDGSINSSDVSASSGYLLVSGRLGVGTTNPTERLTVNGLIKIPNASSSDNNSPGIVAVSDDDFLYDGEYINHYGFGFHAYNDGSGYAGTNAYVSGYYGIDMFTGGTERLRISSGGNVGLGTIAPGTRLHVYGNGGWNAGFRTEYSGGSGNGWNIVDGTDNNLYIGYGSSSAPSAKVVLQNGGNVGIGTTSPGLALDVVGRGRFTGSSTTNSGGAFCATSGQSKYGFVGLDTNSNIGFWGNTASWAFIMDTTSGNVGIGTTAPTSNLHIYDSTIGSYTDNALKVATGYGYATFGSLNSSWFHISTDRPAFYFNNPCQANGGFSTYSSREKKQDIKHLSDKEEDKILDSLSKMQMARFRYKDERFNKKVHLGIITEESPDQLLTVDKKAIELVDYISYAVTAIKAQQRQIKVQQSQIDELKKEIRRLQKK
jgi:hypothetical protein